MQFQKLLSDRWKKRNILVFLDHDRETQLGGQDPSLALFHQEVLKYLAESTVTILIKL